ncbi:ketoacyl-synthetase C-terminal extension domain-containing protein, partial [Streptomyces sp. DT224]|uniref:ketoacyl-synthetase C-terminal extension domain-containing protein n=1 Tax=Streptomyces sp. DT224 TaxID=3393426 RepID=UPI003CF9C601
VMAMRHGVLPQTLHAEQPSPHVDWTSGAVELLTEAREWPESGHPRRAGVSSFGVSGTNAHVIIEQGDALAEPTVEAAELPVLPWLVSARTPEALRAQAARLDAWVTEQPAEVDDPALAWSLASGRSVLEHRAVVVGADRAELVAGLRALAADGAGAAGVVTGS